MSQVDLGVERRWAVRGCWLTTALMLSSRLHQSLPQPLGGYSQRRSGRASVLQSTAVGTAALGQSGRCKHDSRPKAPATTPRAGPGEAQIEGRQVQRRAARFASGTRSRACRFCLRRLYLAP